MYCRDKPRFIAANIENRKSSYLVCVRKSCTQFGKRVESALLHQSVPAF